MKTYLVYSKTMTTALPLVCNDETVKHWERHAGMNIVEMVPASELREREELVQKLADVAFEYEAAHVGEERAESNFVVAHRLRKIDGKWKVCK